MFKRSLLRVITLTRSSLSSTSSLSTSSLSHVDASKSLPCMVDVSRKEDTLRTAEARAYITLPAEAFSLINCNHPSNDSSSNRKVEINSAKGPVFSTAIIAGTMAAKKTSDIIPFCHTISLSHCGITIDIDDQIDRTLQINCKVKTFNKTGVEMEALVGASTTALCIYDMLKAISHDIVISNIHLINKSGGKRNVKDNKQID